MPRGRLHLENTFKVSNKNYISAIATTFPDVQIETLTPLYGISIENKQCKDLPQLIDQIKATQEYLSKPQDIEMRLTIRCSYIQALQHIFPNFDPQNFVNLQLDPKKLEHIENQSAEAFSYIRSIKHINSMGQDLFIVPPKLGSLTLEEAWKILTFVHKKTPIRSAIDVPSENTIYVVTEETLFKLEYGENAELYEDMPIGFDIDDGFIRWGEGGIPNEFTDAFNQWKTNGYKEPIFKPFLLNLYSGDFDKIKTQLASLSNEEKDQFFSLKRAAGQTVLEYAILQKDIDLITLFIEEGADLEGMDEYSSTHHGEVPFYHALARLPQHPSGEAGTHASHQPEVFQNMLKTISSESPNPYLLKDYQIILDNLISGDYCAKSDYELDLENIQITSGLFTEDKEYTTWALIILYALKLQNTAIYNRYAEKLSGLGAGMDNIFNATSPEKLLIQLKQKIQEDPLAKSARSQVLSQLYERLSNFKLIAPDHGKKTKISLLVKLSTLSAKPFLTSIFSAGLTAIVLSSTTLPVLMVGAITVGAATYTFLNFRSRFYNRQINKLPSQLSELDATKHEIYLAGKQAANSMTPYFGSYLSLKKWQDFETFGAGMQDELNARTLPNYVRRYKH